MSFSRIPRVAGESARVILDTLRSLPLTVGGDGRILVHDPPPGPAAEALRRAYERMEMEVAIEGDRCEFSAYHSRMDAVDWREIILRSLAHAAKKALGQHTVIDPLWLCPSATVVTTTTGADWARWAPRAPWGAP